MRLKYYKMESDKYDREKKLTDVQVSYIFKRLKTKYKFRQYLTLYGHRDSGRCGTYEIRLSHNPSIQATSHEIAHAIDMKKGRRKSWHNKRHSKITERVYKYIESHLNEWIEIIEKKESRNQMVRLNREKKKKNLILKRKSPEHKLAIVIESIKRWESKQKRADNALKKLRRRERFLLKRIKTSE